ncbi:ribosome biogenesis protein [Canna indica]|uniref:Ribosome biogenesis protein n=1 Tax=Canna indica TaxID=4628 RepID=A0AAQ3QMT9_9LILI|nr:ribosome biogenesis protein [Canna indica]
MRSTAAAVAVVMVAVAMITGTVEAGNHNDVYQPCADAKVQRWDGFTFGIAFSPQESFYLNKNRTLQLSPCDSRLSLASSGAKLAVFRPKVDEISLLTVNTTTDLSINTGGYMVAFAGRKYAARSPPIFVGNNSYAITSFTLVLEFKKGTLQNLYWKTDSCSSCSGKSNFVCIKGQGCAIKTSNCKGPGGSGNVDCSIGIQLAFSAAPAMGKSRRTSKNSDGLENEIAEEATTNSSVEGTSDQDDESQLSDSASWSEEEGSQGSPYDSGEDDEVSLDDENHRSGEESDSSEDEVPSRNTIGDVPLEWYKDEEHIGYDVAGKKIKKQARKDRIESFLAGVDDAKNWRKIYDEYNDEEVELTKEEVKLIGRLLKGKAPHAEFDPYAPYVDWFEWEDKGYPLSNAPEPKRRFIPSKWEQKKVIQYVRAIRKGIKFDKPKEEPKVYLLWGDDSNAAENKRHGLSYIPAPKPKLAGHEESYNPSVEYIPTQEEINSYQLMYEEDRPKFIPRRFESLRSVPAYENALKESFDRCLDLYLCPRTRKKRINIDPESLKPKLPSRKDLRPYPSKCYLEYKGHRGPVKTISIEISGQWMASGSTDGTVRIWEIETTRCLKVWNVGEAVQHIVWNPLPELPILAISVGHDVLLLDTGLGNAEDQARIKELLHVEESTLEEDGNTAPIVRWVRDDKYDGIRLKHLKAVTTVEWHRKGDYFTTIVPSDILIMILLWNIKIHF